MCFLKESRVKMHPLFNDRRNDPEAVEDLSSIQSASNHQLPFFIPHDSESSSLFFTKKASSMPMLLSQLMANSAMMMKLHEKCDLSENTIDEAMIETKDFQVSDLSKSTSESWRSKQKIIEKIFGDKEYRYKLRLKQKIPSTIYKERNLSFGVELVDSKKQKVLNANLINVCVSACQDNGDWVRPSQNGQYFIQGKTQIDLYHGQGSFAKIYPRDVSRNLPHGKVSFIIYPKPSVLKFSNSSSSLEEHINAEDIQPLIIKGIVIKAKKRNVSD